MRRSKAWSKAKRIYRAMAIIDSKETDLRTSRMTIGDREILKTINADIAALEEAKEVLHNELLLTMDDIYVDEKGNVI